MVKKAYITVTYEDLSYDGCLIVMNHIHKTFGVEPIKEVIVDETSENMFKLYFLIKPYAEVLSGAKTALDYITSDPLMLNIWGKHCEISSIMI